VVAKATALAKARAKASPKAKANHKVSPKPLKIMFNL
jgi:hypothetical protein